jgi:hypothetical protein
LITMIQRRLIDFYIEQEFRHAVRVPAVAALQHSPYGVDKRAA